MSHRPASLSLWCLFAFASLVALPAVPALANDHRDGAIRGLLGADGDLTGLHAWIAPDGKALNVVMPWAPAATPSTRFSDAVQWVIRVASRPDARSADAAELVILCAFDAAQAISCWAGDEYLHGDASVAGGILSASGRLRVFAGLRNDPFFFNQTGFKAATSRIGAALKTAPLDAAGCPAFDMTTRTEITGLLGSGPGGTAARDDLARQNVLALVIAVDLSLVNRGGPILAVAASTHKRQ